METPAWSRVPPSSCPPPPNKSLLVLFLPCGAGSSSLCFYPFILDGEAVISLPRRRATLRRPPRRGAGTSWSLTRGDRQTPPRARLSLPFLSFHSPPLPPRRQRVTEGVAAAITGPATLGHWDRQRCGSWTTFYDTIVEKRTAATLVFISTFFFCVCVCVCVYVRAAAAVHLPGDQTHRE